MKFFRLELFHDAGVSLGYSWFTARAQAVAMKRRHEAADPQHTASEVEEIAIAPTKAGILAALNRYADHPDNG